MSILLVPEDVAHQTPFELTRREGAETSKPLTRLDR
jgi:hypothetical protein